MKIEDHVVSIELSREMEELGAPQDSIFWWVKHIKSGTNYYTWDLVFGKDENDLVNKYIPAYSVAELGEMLPPSTYSMRLTISKEGWLCDSGLLYPRGQAKKEADARAKMLIYLIREGFVKVEALK